MTRGERWKRFFQHKGWLVDDVVSGGKEGTLKISACPWGSSTEGKTATFDTALVYSEYDILCYESTTGSVFIQWDDIIQVRIEEDKKKRGWL